MTKLEKLPLLAVLLLIALIPASGSRFYVFLVTDILIFAIFALSLNLMLGYTGLVSFGHAAYFGIGVYTCALLIKKTGLDFLITLPVAGVFGATSAFVIGLFCVRLTKIYFAMLTLAFSQIVWVIVFKWNTLTGGDNGIIGIDFPSYLDSKVKFFYFVLIVFILVVIVLRRIVNSPFGRILITIRENPDRTEFIGINVKLFQLLAFVISGFFAAIAGGMFCMFNNSVFPDYLYWPISAEVLIMTLLGGKYNFFGPVIGAASLLYLRMLSTSYTEYWSLIMGIILCLLLFFFPNGIAGFVQDRYYRWKTTK